MTTVTAIEVLYEDAIDEVAVELQNLNQAEPKHDPEKCGCQFSGSVFGHADMMITWENDMPQMPNIEQCAMRGEGIFRAYPGLGNFDFEDDSELNLAERDISIQDIMIDFFHFIQREGINPETVVQAVLEYWREENKI